MIWNGQLTMTSPLLHKRILKSQPFPSTNNQILNDGSHFGRHDSDYLHIISLRRWPKHSRHQGLSAGLHKATQPVLPGSSEGQELHANLLLRTSRHLHAILNVQVDKVLPFMALCHGFGYVLRPQRDYHQYFPSGDATRIQLGFPWCLQYLRTIRQNRWLFLFGPRRRVHDPILRIQRKRLKMVEHFRDFRNGLLDFLNDSSEISLHYGHASSCHLRSLLLDHVRKI